MMLPVQHKAKYWQIQRGRLQVAKANPLPAPTVCFNMCRAPWAVTALTPPVLCSGIMMNRGNILGDFERKRLLKAMRSWIGVGGAGSTGTNGLMGEMGACREEGCGVD